MVNCELLSKYSQRFGISPSISLCHPSAGCLFVSVTFPQIAWAIVICATGNSAIGRSFLKPNTMNNSQTPHGALRNAAKPLVPILHEISSICPFSAVARTFRSGAQLRTFKPAQPSAKPNYSVPSDQSSATHQIILKASVCVQPV